MLFLICGSMPQNGFAGVARYYFRNRANLPSDSLSLTCLNMRSLPLIFKKGYTLIYSREVPGIIEIVNVKGKIIWSHQSKEAGFKVVRFTTQGTLLCLVGAKENDPGYGNTILELSLRGDTLMILKKGQRGFKEVIHHDILLNNKNEIVALTSEDRIYDLSGIGGTVKDTVRGDGIIVMNRRGQQLWKWTIFDVLNPLQDKNIIKNKKDWVHTNSISFDSDDNYLVSFYNLGQVWKINAKSGQVMWKFGKGGDFQLPFLSIFQQSHAAHINQKHWLMVFDNGADIKRSRTLAFQLNPVSKKATLMLETWLPPSLYSERMGSSYLINDTTLLTCSANKKTVVLTNIKGNFLWELHSSKIASYRAEFISGDRLTPGLYRQPSMAKTTINN
ncbi:MAG: hypothetical protein C5B59_03180 [Bacteroidetes bacterium]|nr:MAG: hypothetical protein C5B59_03180 [Bacteroidota bacterium]